MPSGTSISEADPPFGKAVGCLNLRGARCALQGAMFGQKRRASGKLVRFGAWPAVAVDPRERPLRVRGFSPRRRIRLASEGGAERRRHDRDPRRHRRKAARHRVQSKDG